MVSEDESRALMQEVREMLDEELFNLLNKETEIEETSKKLHRKEEELNAEYENAGLDILESLDRYRASLPPPPEDPAGSRRSRRRRSKRG